MFYGQCDKCGERWRLGTASSCKCPVMSKTVIQMAKEAGFPFAKFGLLRGDDNGEIDADQMLELFAELVRADERNSWPAEMVAMERQVNILTDALAEQPAQQEPVGCLKSDPDEGHVFVPRIEGDWSMLGKDLYTSPQAQRTWVGLMRGVRVEGDTVVITAKGGNDAARELCGALLEEKNT